MDLELDSIKETASRLPSRVILGPDGKPYLTRYLIKGDFSLDSDDPKPCSSIYLHQFHRPDLDRDLHSHPWPWSTSTILHGGYREMRATEAMLKEELLELFMLEYGVGDANAFAEGDYHTIVEILPDTWTLFSVGPVDRTWYFWSEGKPVHWKEYLGCRGQQVEVRTQ